MAKKNSTTPPAKWSRDWSVGVRVWVERQGQTVLDEPIADVLLALNHTKSISAAARVLGISYRHAWLLIQQANENAGQPLVETAVGGQRGGGARLTEYGRVALDVFRQVNQQVHTAASNVLPRIVASTGSETATIHLAAAISLQEVVTLVLSEYALVRPTVAVRTIFGASNELADQIAAGGPVDVFLSAHRSHLNRLAKEQLIDRSSRRALASNSLVIVGDKSLADRIRKPTDLGKIRGRQMVIADPACPLGACTTSFLKSVGLWDTLDSELQRVENSRSVVSSLRSGQFHLGIIFGSDVGNATGMTVLLQIPEADMTTLYEGAVIATSEHQSEALALLCFFASEQVQGAWRRCGFSTSTTRPSRPPDDGE